MKKYIVVAAGVVVVILLIFSIMINSRLERIEQALDNQRGYIQSLDNGISQIRNQISSVTDNIRQALEEQQKVVADAYHTTLGYDKSTKIADMRISVTFKEMEKNSEVLLKTVRNSEVSTVPMKAEGGLSYSVDIKAGLDDEISFSAVIDGSVLKEEYLFDLCYKDLLENRINIDSRGWGTSYWQTDKKVEYNSDFGITNKHDGDKSLYMDYCKVVLQADGKTVFSKEWSADNDEIYSDGDYDRIKVQMGGYESPLQFSSEKDTELELIVTVIDNLGLTYEYREKETLFARDSAQGSSNSGTHTERLIEKPIEPGYNEFRLVD
ncbi:MAG TPA: hypothetical protein GXX49_10915 [Clostridiaceae bacterium]|nr:hypothetical protein [Clostridiaceae bacterium]